MSFIGIDIGGTKCAVAKGTGDGEILDKIKFETTSCTETIENIISVERQYAECYRC